MKKKPREGRRKYGDDFGVFVPLIKCFIIFILGKIFDPLIKMVRNMKKKKKINKLTINNSYKNNVNTSPNKNK